MTTRPALIKSHWFLSPEDEATAMARYKGFAADFYARLFARWPHLRDKFVFFRDARSDDIWSVCELPDMSFGVQLDPDIELICLWDADWPDEIGTWHADPVEYAIDQIRQRFLPTDPPLSAPDSP